MPNIAADYDTPWKEALEQYFESFLSFFFPQIHQAIDWRQGYQSLDKELQQVVQDAEFGQRRADKLFKVWLHNGQPTWILIHVEIQSQEEAIFEQRMYVYNYRCFDRYRTTVVSLAVLGDDNPAWRPCSYEYSLGNAQASFKFLAVKLLDFVECWDDLAKNLNPFAMMVMAHLKTKATTGKPRERQQWKWQLIRRLYEQGYDRKDIVQLFRLIDWMMTLPKELQQDLQTELQRYQEEKKMPFLSRMELMAKEETARKSVAAVLQARFQLLPSDIVEALERIEALEILEQLLPQAATVGSIEDFRQALDKLSEAGTNTIPQQN